jgi:hypothetical protein
MERVFCITGMEGKVMRGILFKIVSMVLGIYGVQKKNLSMANGITMILDHLKVIGIGMMGILRWIRNMGTVFSI